MYLRWTLLVIFIVQLLCGDALAADPAAKIKPILPIYRNSELQPFEGTAQFVGNPGFGEPCSVVVNVTCVKTVRASERIRLETADAYGLVISPDSVVWNGPIDSGATLSAQFVFQPQEVGTYQLNITRRLYSRWKPLTALILAISEDGKTVYAGSSADCRLNSIPPHPQRNYEPLTVRFPLRGAVFDPLVDRHFTGEFRFSQPPAVNDSVYVEFALECQIQQYCYVQFILDYSTNLRVSGLSRSWGEDVYLTDSSRFYTGGFWVQPRQSGISVLNLRVVGKREVGGRIDRATSELPIYFVTGDDGRLLLICSFEPWTRYKKRDDPMLGGLTSLLEVKNRDYRLTHVLSKPDYQGEENDMPADSPATGEK